VDPDDFATLRAYDIDLEPAAPAIGDDFVEP
jgi:hypothetical protein